MVKAIEIGPFGLDNLRMVDREVGPPAPGEVSVSVSSVSLNYRDYLMVTGAYNPRLPLPLIPCSDGAGNVSAVGSGVTGLKVGDRVCSTMVPDWQDGCLTSGMLKTTMGGPVDGMLCQRRNLPESALVKVPDYLSFDEAACLPVAGLTAWSSLVTEGAIGAGDKVLLLGTGGVSMMALGIAKALGAEVVITSGSDEKLARAKELGADHVINYKTTPRWDKAVLGIYPEGVNCTLEVGGDGTFDRSVKATGFGGVLALIGVLAANNTPVNLTATLMKRLRIQGILVGCRAEFAEYTAFLDKHQLRPVIGATFNGLEQTREAFELMASGGHFGKIVIQF